MARLLQKDMKLRSVVVNQANNACPVAASPAELAILTQQSKAMIYNFGFPQVRLDDPCGLGQTYRVVLMVRLPCFHLRWTE
jgi:hypothetical protein